MKISFYRVKKGIKYLKHYGWKEFWVRVRERLETGDKDYDTWYQKHKVSEDPQKSSETSHHSLPVPTLFSTAEQRSHPAKTFAASFPFKHTKDPLFLLKPL